MAVALAAPSEEPTYRIVEIREGAIVATLLTGCTAREAGRIARALGEGFTTRQDPPAVRS
jgi:hypothetical protein